MESAAACTGSRAPRLARTDAHGFARALHDVFGRCTARSGLKSSAKRIKCNDNTRAERFRALLGLPWMQTSPFGQESSAESAAGGRPAPHLSLSAHKSTAGTRARPRRAQALDVHCVLDPSNSSNPSDGAPLDQLCPSMRGCLSIRAAVNAHSAATHNKTSNAGTRSAARHQVAGQAQPPAAR